MNVWLFNTDNIVYVSGICCMYCSAMYVHLIEFILETEVWYKLMFCDERE